MITWCYIFTRYVQDRWWSWPDTRVRRLLPYKRSKLGQCTCEQLARRGHLAMAFILYGRATHGRWRRTIVSRSMPLRKLMGMMAMKVAVYWSAVSGLLGSYDMLLSLWCSFSSACCWPAERKAGSGLTTWLLAFGGRWWEGSNSLEICFGLTTGRILSAYRADCKCLETEVSEMPVDSGTSLCVFGWLACSSSCH